MTPLEPCPQRVTYHAVARFCERILGVVVEGPFTNERSKAEAHALAVSSTIPDLQELIWTKGLAATVAAGFTTFNNQLFTAKIDQPQGIVMTITPPLPNHKPKGKLKTKTKAENQRHRDRFFRRYRHTDHSNET